MTKACHLESAHDGDHLVRQSGCLVLGCGTDEEIHDSRILQLRCGKELTGEPALVGPGGVVFGESGGCWKDSPIGCAVTCEVRNTTSRQHFQNLLDIGVQQSCDISSRRHYTISSFSVKSPGRAEGVRLAAASFGVVGIAAISTGSRTVRYFSARAACWRAWKSALIDGV